MSALISFRVQGEGSLRDAVEALSEDFGDVLDEFGERFSVVQAADSAFGSAVTDFVAIDIEMKAFTEAFLDDLRPLLRLFKRLVEKYSEEKILATVTFSENGIEESYEL